MACYCNSGIRYRGRLISVHWRYCQYMSFSVIKGKELRASKRDIRKIIRLAERDFIGCDESWRREEALKS